MVDGIEQFRRGIAAHNDPKYTARPSYRALDVTNVQKTSAGAVESISGFTDDGGAELRVPMGGKAAAVGDRVLVSFDPTAPAGAELQYIRHVAADHPGAGLVIVDADLPIPTFAAVWHTSSIVANPGRITARASVMFNMLGDKYGPSGYIVSHRYDPGGGYTDWRDSNFIPHSVGGTIGVCNLGSDFPPSCVIDVKIRAFFNWTNSSSLASLPQSFVAAADANTPGNAGGLTVSEGTPGLAVLTATGSVDASLFAGWSYEIATSPSGPATATSPPQPGMWVIPSPGTFYARVRPISKSGTYGAYFPVSGWQGPYTIIAPYYPDTTPPPVWATQPTLVNASYIDPQNVWRGIVSVTLPGGYSFPSDYAYTMIRLQNITTGYTRFERIEGTALGPIAVDMGAGTIKVDAVGFDKTNNRQSTFGTQATIVLTQPWLPTGTLTVTTQTKGVGIAILWSGVADALWYEVWRSTSSIGTGATRLYERVEGFGAFDPLLDSAVAPTYYYQVRAFNTAGAGPVSSGWTAGTPGKIDGQNIKLASLTAGLVNGVEAFFQGLTVSGVLLTGGINTGSSTQSRIELRGNALANPNMMRLIERIGGVDIVRSIIDGAGLTVYGDPAVGSPANIRMYRHTDGYGRFSAHNIDIMRNLITVDVSSSAAMKFIGGANGDFQIQQVSYNAATNVGLASLSNTVDTAFGFVQGSKYIWLNGGNYSTQAAIEFGGSSVPDVSIRRNAADQLSITANDFVNVGAGILAVNTSGRAALTAIGVETEAIRMASPQTGSWGGQMSLGFIKSTNLVTDWQGIAGRWTVQRALGTTGSTILEHGDYAGGAIMRWWDGSAWKFQVNAGRVQALAGSVITAYKADNSQYSEFWHDGNFHLGNTQGSMYYGWATNPGGMHYFSRGGGAGGTIWCDVIQRNTETTPSDPRLKTALGDETGALEKVRRIKVQRFKYKDDVQQHGKKARQRVGVMADEIRAIFGDDAVVPVVVPMAYKTDKRGKAIHTDEPDPAWLGEDGQPMLAIDSTFLQMTTLRAVQETDERTDVLAAQLAEAVATIKELAAEVAALKRRK